MRRDSGSKLMWGVMAVVLLWFVERIGAIPLESWDDKIPNAGNRFKVLSEFNGQAVLDKETQLVWELSPTPMMSDWVTSRFSCLNTAVGGRKGWRLPSIPELASLIDPSVPFPGPTLPPGHPFQNVQSDFYWSATTDAENPTIAWEVRFSNGNLTFFNKGGNAFTWCVRGGMNADQY